MCVPVGTALVRSQSRRTTEYHGILMDHRAEKASDCCRLCKDFQKANAYLSVPAETPHLCLQHTRPASAYLLPLSTHPNIHPDGAGIGLPGASILALDLIGGHPVFLLLTPGWSLREQMISSLLCPRIALQSCCFHRPAWVWFS